MAAKFPQTFEISHREADMIDAALRLYATYAEKKFSQAEIKSLGKRFGEQLYMGSDR